MYFNKNMKAGYQGRKDSMRNMAESLMDHPGHAEAVYFSKSAADRERMRPYKDGGHVKQRKDVMKNIENFKGDMEKHRQQMHHEYVSKLEKAKEEKMKKDKMKDGGRIKKKECGVKKFAMGGVAKIRHDEATKDGMPKKDKGKSIRDLM